MDPVRQSQIHQLCGDAALHADLHEDGRDTGDRVSEDTVNGAYGVLDRHLASRDFAVGGRPTIVDLSLCGYLFFGDELGVDPLSFANIGKWLDRIRALPDWKHPYELMGRAYRSE